MNNNDPIIQLVGVHKRFGSVEALKNIDLSVYPGEVLGLLGDNGAGKSTLVKCLSGVHTPTSGQICWEGSPVAISSPAIARSLGIETVFQDLALVPNLNSAANLFIGRELGWGPGLFKVLRDRDMDQDLEECLAKLSIHIPSVHSRVDTFSGGQRQALAIARAIRWEAKLVILDEPTAALGVAEQKKVLALTRQLAEKGIAVIYITHNILDVIAVTDRVVVLHRGRKAAEVLTQDSNEHDIVSLIMGKGMAEAV